ncbi:MAG: PLP-dependent aminotransferase family protein [Sulfolobales archaeon]|nr:PLP-dependent aminotransferase family protein [Sulfolobales archaeon]
MSKRYFSKRVLEMRPSMIRELVKKYYGKADIVDLTSGKPHPSTFPVEIIKELINDALDKASAAVLQYGPTLGYSELIKQLKSFIEKRYGINLSNQDIIVTTGSAQALDLIGATLINPGEVLIVEAPTYTNAIDAFTQYNAKFVQIPIDEQGMMVEVVEEELKLLKSDGVNVKFLYTIPTFHNPAGITMSEDRRKYLLELASRYDFLIVEDDAYRELSYSDEVVPPAIKRWDSEGRVIYCGTFSKVLAPGFRVGWMVAEPETIRMFEIVKQRRDLHTSTFCQFIASEYIRRGYLEQHVLKIRQFYRPKLKVMLNALEEYMPEGFTWTKPEGGMFVWVIGPTGLNTTYMLSRAVENGVAYVPGEAFYVDGSVKNAMRLNFSFPDEEEIAEGVKRLAKTCSEEIIQR